MNIKRKVNFVVTDLDDTIWDWLLMWYNSFEPYLRRISNEFNVDIEVLKKDFKEIHQKYGSGEFSFVYHELKSLSQAQKDTFDKSDHKKKSIIHEYNSLKKNNLVLCNGVLKTLKKIKENGALIVGFTESNAFFTKYRIKHLELDGLLDCVYAPVDMGIPDNVYKYYSEEFWQPDITEMRYLPKSVIKPAPEILEIILKDFNANKESTIYIGDKLDKDISMANVASITSVYAQYGHKIETKEYELLRDVTHWTEKDVQREKDFKEEHKNNPLANYTLEKSFDELTKHFSFFPFNHKINPQNVSNVIKIWEKVIDVQQHFNDIELRIRNLAITTFTFIIGGIGYLEKENLSLQIKEVLLPYSTILAFFGVVILFAFFYMDKFWYHRLLQGAVNQGRKIEQKWSKYIPEINLSQSIKNSSSHRFLWHWEIRSEQKFRIFYGMLIAVLFLFGGIIMWFRN
jgi:phosphoglycolate phosphatase-like HAD superfamily hydrolase